MPRTPVQNEALRAQRKAQILDAALSAYVQRGYDGADIDDIAARAGIAKGLMYYYYKTKRALFCELFDTMFSQSDELSKKLLADCGAADNGDDNTAYTQSGVPSIKTAVDYVDADALRTNGGDDDAAFVQSNAPSKKTAVDYVDADALRTDGGDDDVAYTQSNAHSIKTADACGDAAAPCTDGGACGGKTADCVQNANSERGLRTDMRALETLLRYCYGIFTLTKRDPRLIQFCMRVPFDAFAVFGAEGWREGAARAMTHRAALERLIALGMAQGDIPQGDVRMLASSFWTVFVANLFDFSRLMLGKPCADSAAFSQMTAFCMGGLGAQPEVWKRYIDMICGKGETT